MDDQLEIGEGAEEMYERLSLTVDKGQEPLRIDKFLQTRIQHATRNKVQKAIEFGHVIVNGKVVKSNYKVKPGDNIIAYSDT
jgi:23S rRNA pseudouridine1911/1915/1917 synthase